MHPNQLLDHTNAVRRCEGAVRRLRAALNAADAGGYGKTGWYSYVNRDDVEAVLDAVELPRDFR